MTGMLSTETADIAQLRGGGNPFEGVPIGLPEGIGTETCDGTATTAKA